MAKRNKASILDDEIETGDITSGANLKENTNKKETQSIQVHKISKELVKNIIDNGESFSNFAKRAIRKLAQEENII